jgi:hypothetical protein
LLEANRKLRNTFGPKREGVAGRWLNYIIRNFKI